MQSPGQSSPPASTAMPTAPFSGSKEPVSRPVSLNSPLLPTSTQVLELGESALGYRDIAETSQDNPSLLVELQHPPALPHSPGNKRGAQSSPDLAP